MEDNNNLKPEAEARSAFDKLPSTLKELCNLSRASLDNNVFPSVLKILTAGRERLENDVEFSAIRKWILAVQYGFRYTLFPLEFHAQVWHDYSEEIYKILEKAESYFPWVFPDEYIAGFLTETNYADLSTPDNILRSLHVYFSIYFALNETENPLFEFYLEKLLDDSKRQIAYALGSDNPTFFTKLEEGKGKEMQYYPPGLEPFWSEPLSWLCDELASVPGAVKPVLPTYERYLRFLLDFRGTELEEHKNFVLDRAKNRFLEKVYSSMDYTADYLDAQCQTLEKELLTFRNYVLEWDRDEEPENWKSLTTTISDTSGNLVFRVPAPSWREAEKFLIELRHVYDDAPVILICPGSDSTLDFDDLRIMRVLGIDDCKIVLDPISFVSESEANAEEQNSTFFPPEIDGDQELPFN